MCVSQKLQKKQWYKKLQKLISDKMQKKRKPCCCWCFGYGCSSGGGVCGGEKFEMNNSRLKDESTMPTNYKDFNSFIFPSFTQSIYLSQFLISIYRSELLHQQDVTQCQFLREVKLVWIRSFPSPGNVAMLKLKNLVWPIIYQ